MIIKNQVDVWKSPFLNNFKNIAKDFGLTAQYINVNDPPDIAGLYLALYHDKNFCQSLDSPKIRKYVNENKREGGLNLRGRFLRLDGCDDFISHEQALTYLRNVEMIQRAYKQNGVTPPAKISDEAALYIRSYYACSVNLSRPQFIRASYQEQLKQILQKTNEYYDPKTDKVVREDFDTGLSKKQNDNRSHVGRNNVTTDHLTRSAGNVESVYVRAKFREDIINALNQTDYLYSVSPVIGDENGEFENGELFGSKEDNDTRRFVLSYDANYSQEVRCIYEKVLYPELFHMKFKDFEHFFSPLDHIQILDATIPSFVQKCVEKRIPFAFDEHGDTSYIASLPITYPHQLKEKVDKILLDIAKESEERVLARDGLISEQDIITEKDLFGGGLVEIDPEDADKVRINGKSLQECMAEIEDTEH